MKISVIVTNFNYGKWLRRCVRSLLNQNFSNYEIIIVDDVSTDDSKDILLEYKDNDKIKVFFNKINLGVGYSSTFGAKMALGKYIVRVDADDYVHEDFLKCLYLWAHFNNSHAVACDYQEVNFNEDILEKKSQQKHTIACGILYRTDLLEYLGYWGKDLRINEDVDMIKRFKKEFKLEYLNIPLYRYFKHENSLTNGGID
jgi:glycosyltransferase involved in cell wall biosynthesis